MILRFLLFLIAISTCSATTYKAYTGNGALNTSSFFSTDDNIILGSVPIGSTASGEVAHPDGTKVYIANAGSNTISVIDTNTNAVTTITGITQPIRLAISSDGSNLYVLKAGGAIVEIDTATNTILQTSAEEGSLVTYFALSPDGTKIYTTEGLINRRFYIFDVATFTYTGNTSLPAGAAPTAVAFSPTESIAYIARGNSTNTVNIIDTTNNTVSGSISLAPGGGITAGVQPAWVIFSNAGTTAYVLNQTSKNVSVIDTATSTVIEAIDLEISATNAQQLAITPDDSILYTANGGEATYSYIRTSDNTLLGSISVAGASANTIAVVQLSPNTTISNASTVLTRGLSQKEYSSYLSWYAPTNLSVASFNVYRDNTKLVFLGSATAMGNFFEFREHNLNPNQTYTYFVTYILPDGFEDDFGTVTVSF